MKYPREKIFYPRNIHEKILDPRNTHEKNLRPSRKYSELTICPQENFSDPRRHDGIVARDPRWHETNGT